MKLLDIYALLDKGDITIEEAANALDITPKTMRFHLTRWGHRLPLLLSILDKVREDKITRSEAAEALQVTERQVNQLMGTWNVHRPIKPYLLDREKAQVKWELRKRFAIEFIGGGISLEDAAEKAEVSDRQMRRWVADLLDKHFKMPWSDLKEITEPKRRKLAEEIEQLERLELSKAHALNAIAAGKKTVEAEAVDRLMLKSDREAKE